MTGRPNREYRLDRFSDARLARPSYKNRRPFWLPAASYYVLTAAITLAFFFIVWGILNDGGEETPWIPAGIAASLVLGSAVILREIILRKARTRFLLTQNKLDANLKSVSRQFGSNTAIDKLTLEQNAEIVKDIQKKSEVARVSGKLSKGHLEVFEVCSEYLALNKKQLETVGIGSPRLASLRRGREVVQKLHHLHLLAWAESESLALTRESKIRATMPRKLESAQKALEILESALGFYPSDRQLLESEKALKEFITSIKVSHWIEQAERAAFKGNYKSAINHYRDALFFMEREGADGQEKESIAERILVEIEKLRVAPPIGSKGKLTQKSEHRKQGND